MRSQCAKDAMHAEEIGLHARDAFEITHFKSKSRKKKAL